MLFTSDYFRLLQNISEWLYMFINAILQIYIQYDICVLFSNEVMWSHIYVYIIYIYASYNSYTLIFVYVCLHVNAMINDENKTAHILLRTMSVRLRGFLYCWLVRRKIWGLSDYMGFIRIIMVVIMQIPQRSKKYDMIRLFSRFSHCTRGGFPPRHQVHFGTRDSIPGASDDRW